MSNRERLNLIVAAGLLGIGLALIAALVLVRETDVRGHLVVLIGTNIGALAGVLRGVETQDKAEVAHRHHPVPPLEEKP